MKRVAIVCAKGFGDALLMQISAASLRKIGYETVTFSSHLLELKSWFPGFAIESLGTNPTFDSFDAIFLQYDNTEIARHIRALPKPVYILYGDYQAKKHGAFRSSMDVALDRTIPMAINIARATSHLFSAPLSLENGLTPPPHLLFRKYPKRIILHPTSTSLEKNWPKASFFQLRDKLLQENLDPVFIAPPHEASAWKAPRLATLADLATFLYESSCLIGNDSGPGHLASNLGLPTLIIGPSAKHLALWRPGWKTGSIAHPPKWVTEFKITRNKWMNFVSVNKVFKIFNKIKTEI